MEWGEFQRIAADVHNLTQHSAPYRTGNLALNAVRLRYRQVDGHNEAHITADMKIAPYMPYTNEPWVSSRWKGAKNPNLYWFDFAVRDIVQRLASLAGGTVKESKTGTDLTRTAAEMMCQNGRGDYVAPDFYTNSEYIANTEGVSFIERYMAINK